MAATRLPRSVSLEEARKLVDGYTQAHVHEDFKAAGGRATIGTVEDWLREKRLPRADDFALLCHVINNRCEQAGEGRPLPEIPFLLRPAGDDEANNPTSEGETNRPFPRLKAA